MNAPPLVSVCLMVYQHEKYIRQCIDGVLMQQTNFDFEIIIGEDGSTDGTREICREYAAKYPDKIRLFLRRREDVIYINNKPTGRFNFMESVKAARGKYFALCEGDDYWTDPLKLQKQADKLEADPSLVCCHHWQRVTRRNAEGIFVEEEARKTGDGYWPEPVASVREIFANKMRVKTRTTMYRNLFLEGLRLPGWFTEIQFADVPLSFIFGKKGNFAFINEEMAVYRITEEGASMAGIRKADFMYNHYIEWVKIWEYADRYYEGKYREEAYATITHFYKVILKYYKYAFATYKLCAKYALLKSKLPFFYRCVFFTRLSWLFLVVKLKMKSADPPAGSASV